MNEMNAVVEFTGISRMVTGLQEWSCPITAKTTLHDIVSLLAEQFPAMKGQIIEKDGKSLIATNLFSLNGEKIVRPEEMDETLKPGDRLILISLLAGG